MGTFQNSSMIGVHLSPRKHLPRVSGMHKTTHAPRYLPPFGPADLLPFATCLTAIWVLMLCFVPRLVRHAAQTLHTGTARVDRAPSKSG